METEKNASNPFIIAIKSKKFKIKRRKKNEETNTNIQNKIKNKTLIKMKNKKKKKLKITKKIVNKKIILLPTTNSEHSELVDKYLKQLTDLEIIILNIAQEELCTSYNIEKSIGYLKWLDKENGK